jgi:DNA-binding IclR family transcriptional regulator
MQAIRKSGYAISFGELDLGKVGLGVPLFRRDRSVAGSLCLVLTRKRYEAADHHRLIDNLLESAERISGALEPVDPEPRARRKITAPSTRSSVRP